MMESNNIEQKKMHQFRKEKLIRENTKAGHSGRLAIDQFVVPVNRQCVMGVV